MLRSGEVMGIFTGLELVPAGIARTTAAAARMLVMKASIFSETKRLVRESVWSGLLSERSQCCFNPSEWRSLLYSRPKRLYPS